MASQLQLSAEAAPQLQEGIALLFSRWSALQMAVDNEWGGRDSRLKSQQLAADIFSWFTQSKEPLYIDDLEGMLYKAMLSLNTFAEDGSIEEVAEKLMIIHEECLEGNYTSIEKLREANSRRQVVTHIRQVVDDEDDDDDGEHNGNDDSQSMLVDVPEQRANSNPVSMQVDEPMPAQSAEAEDGWVLVSSRRSRGKRH